MPYEASWLSNLLIGGVAPEYSVAKTLIQSMRSKQPVEQLLNVIDTTATAMELPPDNPSMCNMWY